MSDKNPMSLWCTCPLCDNVEIEIRRDNPYKFEDHSLVDAHKKEHQRTGMVLS